MSTEEHLDMYRRLARPCSQLMESYAIVGVDKKGRVFWGSHFAHEPERLLHRLDTIRADIRQHIKTQGKG